MITSKGFIQFCCMGHEMMFSEDFHSDDEGVINACLAVQPRVSFLPYESEEVARHSLAENFDEKSVQCDSAMPCSLLELSLKPSVSTCNNDKVLVPSSKAFSLTHTARVSLLKVRTEFHCKSCDIFFKNGQALGGHLSKNH